MTITVTYAIDSMDPNPTVETFDTVSEAQEWVHDEIQRRIDWCVSHSPYAVSDDEIEAMRETEYSLIRWHDSRYCQCC